jgi:PAS domain S-box-containing protein
MVGSISDITERKRAEEALRESEARYRALFETSDDGILIADLETKIFKYANPAICRMLMYSEEELRAMEVTDIHPKDALQSVMAEFEALARGDKILAEGLPCLRKDGTVFYADINAVKITVDGKACNTGFFRDITDRKKKEVELAAAQQLYRELFNSVAIGILRSTPGPNGTFIDVNPAMVRMFEADSREQFMALHPSEIYWDESQRTIVSDAIVAKGFIDEEVKYNTLKGNLIWCHIYAVKRIDADGQIYFDATIEDITERKRAEAELATASANLEKSNKELEQFAYVASHDLQEPLRMVSSYTQLLAQKYEGQLDDKAKKYIAYAVDGAIRMQRLINDLLTYSRISTQGKPSELIDSHSVLGEALRNLAATIEENRAVITNEDLPTVRADESQLMLVFQNIIANAIKFRGEEIPRVHISVNQQGRDWVFSVKDNGIGIDPRYSERLFVIFQRLHTKEEYPGTGIGLAVCKRIVERHGGRIWFESELGKGTTFFFTIPKQERKTA